MADLLLNLATDGTAPVLTVKDDLQITGGELQLTTGTNTIRQDLLTRLRTFLGTCHIDTRIGIPYFEQILVKNPDEPAIQAIFKQAILTTEGVLEIQTFSFDFDSPTRTLTIAFQALVTGDEVLTFEEALII